LLAVSTLALNGACRQAQDPNVIQAAGHVEATEVHVATKLGGRLQSVAVREGDVVTAGQELARIDAVDVELALRQARAERDQAQADLRLRLTGARLEDIAELEAQVRSAEADAGAARHDFERMQGLLERGSGTTKARDDAQARRDVTAARVEALQQSLRRLRSGFRDEEKDAARARAAALDARVAQLEQQTRDTAIVSPLNGVISEKVAERGELLQAGAPLLVVTDLRDAWLRVYVSGPDVARLRLGQQAEVQTDDGQKRTGRVSFIASQAEFTPKNVQTRDERVKLVYEVKVTLDNADGLFKPGMPAEARLQVSGGAR
jgi:HlyD family secretion protein